MIAVLAGTGVFMIAAGLRMRRPRLDDYLGEASAPSIDVSSVRHRDVASPLVGAAIGLVAPGPTLITIVGGAGLGLLVGVVLRRSRRRRRGQRLGLELPAVADLLGLYLLSGDTIVGALQHFVDEAHGVAADELGLVLDRVAEGSDVSTALQIAAGLSVHHDGARLYRLLAQAHVTGSRLHDTLQVFATDRRSAITRDLAEEGGRRALTGYGPILGLMVPTTLVFLIYPTVAGLDALAFRP